MIEPIETIVRAGYKAKIYPDDSPNSPGEWDTLGTLAYDTRNASVNSELLPRDSYGSGMFYVECPACEGTGFLEPDGDSDPGGPCTKCERAGYVFDGTIDCKSDYSDLVMCLPVYAYDDRNGTVLEIAEGWEQANGWIFCTQADVEMTGVDPERIADALEAELQAWQQWAQGDVYGVVIEDPQGREVDSCWGFYGLNYAACEARGMLDTDTIRALEANPALGQMVVN